MLTFCPVCANRLYPSVTKPPPSSWDDFSDAASSEPQNTFACRTCPYQFPIERTYYERKEMKRKEVEDVMGGKEAWANVDKSDVQCPGEGCDGAQAFFYQVQIRSADEPMTTFYKCTVCAQRWKEN